MKTSLLTKVYNVTFKDDSEYVFKFDFDEKQHACTVSIVRDETEEEFIRLSELLEICQLIYKEHIEVNQIYFDDIPGLGQLWLERTMTNELQDYYSSVINFVMIPCYESDD